MSSLAFARGGHPVGYTPPTFKPSESDPHFDPAHSRVRPFALEVCRQIVADWEATTARDRDGWENRMPGARGETVSMEEADEWRWWCEMLMDVAYHAERHLCTCVMMICGRIEDPCEAMRLERGWAPVAMELDGRVYFVQACDDWDDPRPKLSVVNAADFRRACPLTRAETEAPPPAPARTTLKKRAAAKAKATDAATTKGAS